MVAMVGLFDEKISGEILVFIRTTFILMGMLGISIPFVEHLHKQTPQLERTSALWYKVCSTFLWLLGLIAIIVSVFHYFSGKIIFVIDCFLFALMVIVYIPVIFVINYFLSKQAPPYLSDRSSESSSTNSSPLP